MIRVTKRVVIDVTLDMADAENLRRYLDARVSETSLRDNSEVPDVEHNAASRLNDALENIYLGGEFVD